MTDQSTVRMVIVGIVLLGALSLGIYAYTRDSVIATLGGTCIGALASMLARTSTGKE